MLYDLLKTRRSIRKFKTAEVEKEKIDTILKSALLSPTSRSRRPWEFIAVTDKEMLAKLARCKEHGSAFLENAPLGIVVAADPEVCDVWVEDASIAAITIQISALSMGLGSCWIQVRNRAHSDTVDAEEYITGILGIPEKFSVECILAVGYPDEVKKEYKDSELLYERIHFDRF